MEPQQIIKGNKKEEKQPQSDIRWPQGDKQPPETDTQ